jgi:Holliday junction DNA helicase RuvA
MIGKLRGMVDSVGPDWVIVDVGGVGYMVHCASRILAGLPAAGGAVTLAIETVVREDQIRLFGFADELEREWFRLLQTVQGVGAKVALAILGVLRAPDLANAVALQDKGAIARAPGVGPKVAARIVAELKDRAPAFADVDVGHVRLQDALGERRAARPVADAVSALVNLGYAQVQASGAVSAALRQAGEDATAETLIRLGLKELAS